MARGRACFLHLAVISLVGFAVLLRAQAPQWGMPMFGAPVAAGWGRLAVNPVNLDVTFSIPMLKKSGRGLPFVLNRVYNSAIYQPGPWGPVSAAGTQNNQTVPYWGWMTATTAGQITWDNSTGYCPFTPCPTCNPIEEAYSIMDGWRFYAPDGTTHYFSGSVSGSNVCYTGNTTSSGTDGEGWTISLNLNGGSGGLAVVTGPDGTVYRYIGIQGDSAEDTNGNQLTVSISSSEIDYYDTTNSTTPVAKVITSTSGCTNPVDGLSYPQCVTYDVLEPASVGSGYVSYVEYDQNVAVSTCFGYSGTATVPFYLLMPQYTSGSSWYWKFGYAANTALLDDVHYPTGGETTLSYGSLCTFNDGSVDLITETDTNGGSTARRNTTASPAPRP